MIKIHEEVAVALSEQRPVVALESTIFSEFGLPPPVNRECLDACCAAIRAAGAVPAVTVVLSGEARVGVDEVELERVLLADEKLGARDIPVAVAGGWPTGATTVSGALSLAAAAGVSVFATGGIGGVHRDVAETGDISADLPAIARYPVTTVTAGAKAFLDLPRTVEYLETLGVPVLGFRTDDFPAFYSRSSGVPLAHRVETPAAAAAVVRAARDLGYEGGVVLAVPIPEEAALPRDALEEAIEQGLAEAEAADVRGAAVTPFILGRLVDATGGNTLEANVALAVNNAKVAAELAGPRWQAERMRVFNVTFDCRDAATLAGFWAQVLDTPVDEGANEFFAVISGEPNLLFIQVPEARTAKNRVHVDLDAPSLGEARERLEGLGATFVHEKDEYGLRWLTFQDPEGNEFCVGSHE